MPVYREFHTDNGGVFPGPPFYKVNEVHNRGQEEEIEVKNIIEAAERRHIPEFQDLPGKIVANLVDA